MEAYVINLKSSKDRWTSIQKSFEPTGIQLHRVDPVNATHVTKKLREYNIRSQSNFLSFLSLIKMAKRKGLPNILLLEDDCMPVPNFTEKWLKVKTWLDTNTDKWDIYSGGSSMIKNPTPIAESEDTRFYRPKASYGSFFIYIHKDAYDTVIQQYTKDFTRSPVVASNVTNYRVKLVISHPFVAYHRDGKSTLSDLYLKLGPKLKRIERELGKTRKIRRKR